LIRAGGSPLGSRVQRGVEQSRSSPRSMPLSSFASLGDLVAHDQKALRQALAAVIG
jgi:hypothetical protein